MVHTGSRPRHFGRVASCHSSWRPALGCRPHSPMSSRLGRQPRACCWLRLRKVRPDSFTVRGETRPGQSVDIQWTTWDGAYTTQTTSQTVAYQQHSFIEKRVSRRPTDAPPASIPPAWSANRSSQVLRC
jgi:hypothetical protein